MTGRICAAGLLYQQHQGTKVINKVRSCLITWEEGDDEFDLKAKAERYFNEHEEISEDIKGYDLVCGWFAVQGDG